MVACNVGLSVGLSKSNLIQVGCDVMESYILAPVQSCDFKGNSPTCGYWLLSVAFIMMLDNSYYLIHNAPVRLQSNKLVQMTMTNIRNHQF